MDDTNHTGDDVAIKFGQIHNLVRTYQRVLSKSARPQFRGDATGTMAGNRLSFAPDARGQDGQHQQDHVTDGLPQQDRERSR
ncbi:MAG: hypothetical protein OEV08_05920 [Nitrospira sp.]|nr:hypothetical protein [Nitrospira sp.]